MKKMQFVMVLALGFIGTGAFADGFKCEGVDSTLNVKVFNKTNPSDGTRNPAALVVSDLDRGTLLVRKDGEISKTNRLNTVRYTVDGNKKIGAETVIAQIQFKQGRETIEAGDSRPGQLILVSDGEREVYELSCERYLKQQ